MTERVVLSLYDFTGEAVRPWAEDGFYCYCFDIQHKGQTVRDGIHYRHADLYSPIVLYSIITEFLKRDVAFVFGWPPCTDLAVSGAAHFARKRAINPDFQRTAAHHAKMCAYVADAFGAPYLIENPVSVLSTLWRKPDYTFHPWMYGRWLLDDEAAHPRWSDYIMPYDAYPKKTCLWTGNGFRMPMPIPTKKPDGLSEQHLRLGGKSLKTKNIRSATPRGFARAVWFCNKGTNND